VLVGLHNILVILDQLSRRGGDMASDQGQQGTQRAKSGRWGVGRWVLLALALVVIAFSCWYGWKKYNDFEWQKAMKARKYADASLPEVSARRLLDAYAKDKDAAISKYSGKRYFVGGRAFDASLLTGNESSVGTAGVAKFTAGSGGSDDRGDRYVYLSSARYWEIAYSSLSTGKLDIAACTIDPNKMGIQTEGDGKYIYADDCSTVVTGLDY
jgi:hypothetical protein